MKTVKLLATGVAAFAVIGGAAAAAASSVAPVDQVRLAAVGAPSPASGWYPQPQDPAPVAADVPTADQLTGVLNSLADPSVPFASKSNLVQGGISGIEAHVADKKLQKAAKNGDLPLSFDITNIQPSAAGTATADVAVSGPKLTSPVTQNITFVNQGGWVLSRASAMELLQAAGQ
ncbi:MULTISPECIES: hypothetical protein [unclassified Mycobacterium]|uniref:hypothetical protein n=1 Tax=unclassified Mycobacterium TaxID=2642494 RepID=UPI000801DF83|nr:MULTISPECIES: hypothetical protein [unclassified Mycobacterium]OBH17089.1 hypothetical protein A9X04_10840 [Mycobacterium sp. E3247]OBI20113.1 hypothetical protein A5713_14560 [Mycobacterium sp. E2497]